MQLMNLKHSKWRHKLGRAMNIHNPNANIIVPGCTSTKTTLISLSRYKTRDSIKDAKH